MKVFLRPTGLHSTAMMRVVFALERYAPDSVTIVYDRESADLHVAHVIASDSLDSVNLDKPHAIIQYCHKTADDGGTPWSERWNRAKLVWSYYDLAAPRFYHSPLGVDKEFIKPYREGRREGVLTSGYVSSPLAEAIEEVAMAAWMLGIPVTHLGPAKVEGMKNTYPTTSLHLVSDRVLAEAYRSMSWVSGLRHVEGFEMPVIEGLCCGARPIVFDRPDMHQWYTGHAVFVPESHGSELVKHLLDALGDEPDPVSEDERQWAIERFDWEPIVRGFWERVL